MTPAPPTPSGKQSGATYPTMSEELAEMADSGILGQIEREVSNGVDIGLVSFLLDNPRKEIDFKGLQVTHTEDGKVKAYNDEGRVGMITLGEKDVEMVHGWLVAKARIYGGEN